MTVEESDRILQETLHVGLLEVTIEGFVPNLIHGEGKSLRVLVDEVFSWIRGEPIISGLNNNPWVLVSYDKDVGTLVVGRKEE